MRKKLMLLISIVLILTTMEQNIIKTNANQLAVSGENIYSLTEKSKTADKHVFFGAYFQSELKDNEWSAARDLSYDEDGLYKLADGRWIKEKLDEDRLIYKYYRSEPIEWIVLEESDDSLLLLSDKILVGSNYTGKTTGEDGFWEDSMLRKWLNNGFLTYGFNESERKDILSSKIETYKSSSESNYSYTDDKVYILDKSEIKNLVASNSLVAYTTNWARGDYTEPVEWWVRGPAIWFYGNLIDIYVKTNGEIDDSNISAMSIGRFAGTKGVRPVIRVKKNSKYLYETKPVLEKLAKSKDITKNMVSLAKNSYKFSGKKINSVVTVKDGYKELKKGKDYKVAYSNNLYAGKAKATITGIGSYKGNVQIRYTIKYNPKKAVKYAKKYAEKYNKRKYKVIENNCTNYVSQCIHAGGLRMTYPKKIKYNNKATKTKDYWYMKKNKWGIYSWSSTWSFVSEKNVKPSWGLAEYITNKRHASIKKYSVSNTQKVNKLLKNCSEGDILQLTDKGKKYPHHSVIVTQKSYDKKHKRYNIKVCYNSENKKNKDFRTYMMATGDKGDTWTLIKMKNAY